MEVIITILCGAFIIMTAIISYYQINKDFKKDLTKQERREE